VNFSGAYLSLFFIHRFHKTYRRQVGEDPKLWIDLRKLWRDLARTQLSFWDNDDSSDEEQEEDNENDSLRAFCTKLAKFTRNLVAGVPENQLRA
jgi:ataxin-10